MALDPVNGYASASASANQQPKQLEIDPEMAVERAREQKQQERVAENRKAREEPPPPREDGKGELVDVNA